MIDTSRPVRHCIRSLLRKHPGARLSDLERRWADVSGERPGRGALLHHLSLMWRERQLLSALGDGERRYYLPTGPWAADPDAWAALQAETTGTVAGWVSEHPGLRSCDVAVDLYETHGWSRSRVLQALDRLESLGLVELRPHLRTFFCMPTERMRTLLALISGPTGSRATEKDTDETERDYANQPGGPPSHEMASAWEDGAAA